MVAGQVEVAADAADATENSKTTVATTRYNKPKDDKDDNDYGIFRAHPSSLNPKTPYKKKNTVDFLRRNKTN